MIRNVLNWVGLICWVLSVILIAYVGSKYQIKYGQFKSMGIELNKGDKFLIKIAGISFILGILLFVL